VTKLREGDRKVALFVARNPIPEQVMPSLKKHETAIEAPPE
jgi:hypothetical protein